MTPSRRANPGAARLAGIALAVFLAAAAHPQEPVAEGLLAQAEARAAGHREQGDFGAAARDLERFLTSHAAHRLGALVRATAAYNLACTLVRAGDLESAFRWLTAAAEGGFKDHVSLKKDPDLVPLHGDERFGRILERVHRNWNYLDLLAAHPMTSARPEQDPPRFSYQRATRPELVQLRKRFRLRRIAGTGNELARARNLMRWVHATVPPGDWNPGDPNTLHLLDQAIAGKHGLNCRMLAIILNDVFAAMGFPSRLVTCLPMDRDENDCHVVTLVFLASLNRWVMMDPTYGAYVTDAQGRALDLADIRSALAKRATLRPAGWTGSSEEAQDYLDYLAKTFFHFECPLDSVFNFEARPGARPYVRLDPPSVPPDPPKYPDKAIRTIHDSLAFWARPSLRSEVRCRNSDTTRWAADQ